MSQTKRIAGYSRGLPLFAAMIIATSLLASCGDSVNLPLDRADCPETINTPKQYAAAVKEFRAPPEYCISPELFTTSLQGGSRLYPEGFDYAWANSSTPPSQVSRPPSKAAVTFLRCTAGNENRAALSSCSAGMACGI